MKLYHFCAPQCLESVRRQGLTLGRTPFRAPAGQLGFLLNTQWMTVNPDFKQLWNSMEMIQYDRAAFRLTFAIPKSARGQVLTWPELKEHLVSTKGQGSMLRDFESDQDTENWRIFMGRVKPGWIRAVAAKPKQP